MIDSLTENDFILFHLSNFYIKKYKFLYLKI